MNAITPETQTAPLDTGAMRAAAEQFIRAGDVLLRYEEVQRGSAEFSRNLWQLIDLIGGLAARRPEETVAAVAMAGVAEAQRRLRLMERAGLAGEHARVTKLARSVVALCDHYETLAKILMCTACDKPIPAAEEPVPYDLPSPSGNAVRSGRLHAACARRASRSR
ncbi:DUF6415 family natural product biosynthesis protein [Streptomyces olivochromogenes]|uniref:DUF6415 family natural product biosynthesis protein n=1 Tax=Streptomyces olivochromogenes TaxID=1963 RepID=UPI001F1861B8|nr:DUF6415 family natural product biosynthesis protein [Streptomyces olivochromogenes]MCF3130730.1 hypothetical protein [Streptomyces olivochromogenes]